MAQRRDPYQEDYERAKAAGFPKPVPRPGPGPRTSTNPAPFLFALGGTSVFVAIVLQFVKVSAGGISLSASQVNGICQSALGQLGQAFSGGFGDNAPSSACGRAATIEDWKGATTWLGIALIGAGLLVFMRRSASTRPGFQASGPQFGSGQQPGAAPYFAAPQPGVTPQVGAAAPGARHAALPQDSLAAERAEAEAARLRAQAAQLRAEQARPQNPPQPGFPYGS
jgi:hypothetical protein